MKKSIFVSCILLVASVLTFSCKTGNKVSAKKGPLPSDKADGPILNISLDSTVDTLDQQIAVYATSFELIGDLVDGLKQMGDDGAIKNAICKEQSVSDDGLVYTFKLRDDVYWSNGEPVTAHDFVYGWQRAVAPETQSEYAFMISEIAQIKNGMAIQAGSMPKEQLGVRAIDDYTFQVELVVPVSYFDQLLYFCTFYPTNQKFIESVGDKYGTSPDTYLSNGAFILKSYEPDTKNIELIKNSAYYDASRVKIGGIHYEVTGDAALALKKYQSGQLDLIEIDSEEIPNYQNSPEFKAVDTGFMYYMAFNMHHKYLKNKNLRRAMTMALDRQKFVDAIADGSKPAWNAVPAGYCADRNGKDFSSTQPYFPELCSFNIEKAREYFELAKQELGTNEITIEFLTADSATQRMYAEEICNQFMTNLPGLKFEYRFVDRKERRKIMARHEFELGLTNWGPDYADPMTYLAMWMTGNDNNNGDYSNPVYDAILAECTDGELCTKLDERWKALKDAERIIMDEAVIMPLFTQCNPNLISPKVKGIAFHAVGISKIYKGTTKN